MIDYYLFDLDGTLTDPFEGITKAVEYSLEHFGIKVDDRHQLEPFIGPPLWQSFEDFCGFSKEQAIEAVNVYREYFSEIGLFENEVYPGIPNMLQSLKNSGSKLLVATSKPKVFADRILDKFDLMKYFDYVDGSLLDGTRVNKDEVIAHTIMENSCIKDRAIMIGDKSHDIIGATKNGIKSIGVTYGYGSRDELEKAGADYIVNSVEELSALLLSFRK